MKILFKIFISFFALSLFSTANAVTIKWLHLYADSAKEMPSILKAVEEYEAKTGNTVELQYLENEAFKAKLPTMLQSNDRPDIFYSWGGGVMYDQARAGFLRDISSAVPSDYLSGISEAAANAFTFEDQRVGLPLQVSQVAWWYNKDLINQAGVDVSKIVMWDDLLDAVKQIKSAGITPICLGGKDKWPVHFIWTHLHIRNGGQDLFLESMNNGGWGRPEYIKSGEQMLDLVNLDPFQDGYLASTWPDQAGMFGDGKCAMALMGNWMYGAQAANSASGEGLGDDNMGMFNMPATKGGLGDVGDTLGGINGWLFSSSASDEAVDLIMHYVSKATQSQDAGNGAYIPVVKGADSSIKNPFLQQVAGNIANSKYHQIFYDQFLGADIGRVVNDVSTDLAAGIISPEEATAQVQEAWEFNQ
jgi:raffinose/stachyose/melibiose transport system substrate-binding protein